MTREESIEWLKGLRETPNSMLSQEIEALDMAIKALENHDTFMKYAYSQGKQDALSQEPCEDAISRSGAIKAIEERAKRIKNEDTLNGLAGAVGILFELPSIKPQEPTDAISREELLKAIDTWDKFGYTETGCFVREPKGDYVPYIHYDDVIKCIKGMPPVTQKSGKCKNCKYFEYDSVAKVDGIPLIVAHEICNKWGDGCKTKEDGYCYLFEPQESEE